MPDHYKGNPNIKGVGVQVQFTEDQLKEYIKCSQNPAYFIKKYVKIVSIDKGFIPFDLYPYQERLIDKFHNNRFVIAKIGRQSGKSVTCVSYLLWTILFNKDFSVAILANKGQTARSILGRLQKSYEALPKWLQQGATVWNKGNVELENGSRIIATSTSASSIRGDTFNIVFLDEFAFVHDNIAEEFMMGVYPTISSGQSSKIFIVSTPNGLNHYYKAWVRATDKKSDYVPFEVHWSEVPGRDAVWKEQQVRNTSEEQFAQEFETEFLGSVNTLIAPKFLKSMAPRHPLFGKDGLEVYEQPVEGHKYFLSADVAKGRGMDYSAFSVVDITEYPYKQVCKYRNNELSHLLYPTEIEKVAKAYNNALVLIELNDAGAEVANILYQELEYENLYSVPAGSGRYDLGLTQTKASKRTGCANLKELIENSKLIINDLDTISELSTFVKLKKPNGSFTFEADGGCHDDLVMGLSNFGWAIQQEYFKDLMDQNLRERLLQERMKDMEENLMPFGFVSDGINDNDSDSAEEDDGFNEWF